MFAVGAAAREEPEAGGYLRRAEELTRQRDDAIDQTGLNDIAADLSLAGRLDWRIATRYAPSANGAVQTLGRRSRTCECA